LQVPTVAQRRERGERRREHPRQAGVLKFEVVDVAGAIARDVRPRARVPVVGPPHRVRVRQRFPKVLQRRLVRPEGREEAVAGERGGGGGCWGEGPPREGWMSLPGRRGGSRWWLGGGGCGVGGRRNPNPNPLIPCRRVK
jgi:hypothetical protein